MSKEDFASRSAPKRNRCCAPIAHSKSMRATSRSSLRNWRSSWSNSRFYEIGASQVNGSRTIGITGCVGREVILACSQRPTPQSAGRSNPGKRECDWCHHVRNPAWSAPPRFPRGLFPPIRGSLHSPFIRKSRVFNAMVIAEQPVEFQSQNPCRQHPCAHVHRCCSCARQRTCSRKCRRQITGLV